MRSNTEIKNISVRTSLQQIMIIAGEQLCRSIPWKVQSHIDRRIEQNPLWHGYACIYINVFNNIHRINYINSKTSPNFIHWDLLNFLCPEKATAEEPTTTEETKEETVVIKEGDKVEADRVEADGDTQSGPVVPDGFVRSSYYCIGQLSAMYVTI